MSRPAAPRAHHSPANRIVAIALAWLMVAGALPAGAISSSATLTPLGSAPRALSMALPSASTLPEEADTSPAPDPADETKDADKWGEITVAQPKIWQYERVNSLLDGLLRDVEGVSLADLTSLDPNATNGAAVKFVQSMLEIGVKYDQGAAVTNNIALQNYAASQSVASAQIDANKTYLQQLDQQRTTVTNQLLAAVQQNATLQGQLATTDPTSAAYTSLTKQQQAAASEVSGLQAELTSINSQITTASSTTMPAAPSLTSTTAGTPPESSTTFSSFLGNLPSDLTKNLVSQLQSPSFPATKRLDNFITLLYERLAREISVLQDDVMRDPENVPFLVQFDVSLYPSSQAKNHVGVVEFTMDCDGCKVYSIYPGQSSYNLANYEGASKRYSLYGAIQTLFGFGINAAYRRQTDTLHGDLVQSVYMSGFQEGALSTDRTNKKDVPQRFGWYYGSAPFETLVTPGIRSTFAIVSVPRSLLKTCIKADPANTSWLCGSGMEGETDEIGTTKIMLKMTAHADWVPRDNPKPDWRSFSNDGIGNGQHGITRNLKVVLPGTDAINIMPEIVSRERERLHVLGMEYNPVYYTPPAKTATGTTAIATAANPSTTPDKSSSSQADPLTGCKQDQCAAVLIKLAEPLDPNLVVTVRGVPLRRVRDWRGRATSILPPVQSESDVPAAAAGGTSSGATTAQRTRSENPRSRSLLEADDLAPNTWIATDSHRLLLHISRDLAGDREFPAIQILDPAKRALFVPIDLDEGFTEIIINGFHLPSRATDPLKNYVQNHFLVPVTASTTATPATATNLKIYPAGPYAYETFLPLFSPQPPPQTIFAFLGETGTQLLIFFGDSSDPQEANQEEHPWLSQRTQVILEDNKLDLAWSLDCYPQGPELVCNIPREQIRDTYRIVMEQCGYPGADRCPSVSNAWKDFPSISTLQVWVEQYDPEHEDYFYTPGPARLGRFPVQVDPMNTDPAAGFSPWLFDSADRASVKLKECKDPLFPVIPVYLLRAGAGPLTILGRHIPDDVRMPPLVQDPKRPECWTFDIPTVALTHEEVVVEYPFYNLPESLSTEEFKPHFGKPVIVTHRKSEKPFSIDRWTVDIPVGRVDCNDSLDISGVAKLEAKWRIGPTGGQKVRGPEETQLLTCLTNWQEASKTGQIHMVLEITRENLDALMAQRQLHVIRGAIRMAVATLPDIRSLIFPTKLTVVTVGKNQFALQGQGAESIDAVSLQGPNGPFDPFPVATGPGIALISLPQKSSADGNSGAANKPTIPVFSPESGQVNSDVTITGKNFGSATGTVTFGGTPVDNPCWNDTEIKVTVPKGAKTGEVALKIGGATFTSKKDFTVKSGGGTFVKQPCPPAPPKPRTVSKTQAAANAASVLGPGTYTVLPLVSWQKDGKQKDDKGNQLYFPLEVTDLKGNPLTYTVPEKKSDAPTPPKGVEGPTTTLTFTRKETKTPPPPSDSEGTK